MKFVIGIDEVGRGPLAGPVAVGAVVLPSKLNDWKHWEGLKDSKKLTEKKRDHWFNLLCIPGMHREIGYAVAMVGADIVDGEGIVSATDRAVARAISKLSANSQQTLVLLDAGLKAPLEWKQKAIIKGDEKEPCIALASIMAKVTRDRHMCKLAKKYPQYGFDKHKGYGTKLHCDAIRAHGLCPLHRRTFCKSLQINPNL